MFIYINAFLCWCFCSSFQFSNGDDEIIMKQISHWTELIFKRKILYIEESEYNCLAIRKIFLCLYNFECWSVVVVVLIHRHFKWKLRKRTQKRKFEAKIFTENIDSMCVFDVTYFTGNMHAICLFFIDISTVCIVHWEWVICVFSNKYVVFVCL